LKLLDGATPEAGTLQETHGSDFNLVDIAYLMPILFFAAVAASEPLAAFLIERLAVNHELVQFSLQW
jgi:hypothetical protein